MDVFQRTPTTLGGHSLEQMAHEAIPWATQHGREYMAATIVSTSIGVGVRANS